MTVILAGPRLQEHAQTFISFCSTSLEAREKSEMVYVATNKLILKNATSPHSVKLKEFKVFKKKSKDI